MSIKKYTESLEQFFNHESILLETFNQIKKDLGSLYSLSEEWKESEYTFRKLCVFLTPLFKKLLEEQPNELVQAFYRIDMAETEIGDAVSLNDSIQRAERISFLVTQRELKKVIIRKYYSDQL